ncbi:lysosome membrane protein 2-like [Heptranchias perlo]|uniref:lysosome membrane protein 2-like n=1 Tax=Heptranchias perlo TaxID=212740 RepID=UPI00355AB103
MTYLRNTAALIGVFALCCFITFVVLIVKDDFTNIVEDRIKEQAKLKMNSEAYKNWKDPPASVYLQFFMFHVENQLQILEGERPIVRQIGPYTYKEIRHRTNVSLFDNATISAVTPRTFIFEPLMSVGDPKNDSVTTINIPFIALLRMLKYSGMVKKIGASILFTLRSRTLFHTRSVDELLWGYEDPILKLGHKLLPSFIKDCRFGLFYGMNGTNDGEYVFNTGKNDYMEFTKIITWKGQKSLSWWTSNSSNMINGTDGASFHPLIKKDETLYLFASDICRSLYVMFEKELEVKGIKAYRFVIPKEIFASDHPDNKGFCPSENCHSSGVLNISICRQGAPVFISPPHFYNGDQKLVNDIIGMKPNMEAHQSFLDIEPMTGIPIRIAKRMQINIHVESMNYITQTGRIRTMILPVIFLNQHAVIDDKSAAKLKWALHKINVVTYIPYMILWMGIFLCLTCVILVLVSGRHKKNKEFTPVMSKLSSAETH